MKKILVASTALVAAGLMTTASASASEKIKLELGGFSKWWVVGAWQDQSYQHATATDYNSADVKGDNEIHFKGSTKLDNGLTVGVQVELEAGGHTDTTTDTIDASYAFVEGGFGKVIAGTLQNGTYLLSVTAPDAAANWNDGGIMTGGKAIAHPSSVVSQDPTSVTNNTTMVTIDNKADKLTYVSPSFYGLTVGGSYVPNLKEDDRGTTDLSASTTVGGEAYGVGALYANTFGGVGVKASAGWVYGDGVKAVTSVGEGINYYNAGLNLSYAGFTLGGSYLKSVGDEAPGATVSYDGNSWDIGLQYATGPYAVSFAYFHSSVEGDVATSANDKVNQYQLSGKYTLGAGVDVLASVGYADYKNEVDTSTLSNSGWTAMTGLSLTF